MDEEGEQATPRSLLLGEQGDGGNELEASCKLLRVLPIIVRALLKAVTTMDKTTPSVLYR